MPLKLDTEVMVAIKDGENFMVMADVVGDLAIHPYTVREIDTNKVIVPFKRWHQLTHIPTGGCIAVVQGFKSLQILRTRLSNLTLGGNPDEYSAVIRNWRTEYWSENV